MAHKIMKHNHNSNNRARSAFNPEERLRVTLEESKKAHKSMQPIMANVNSMSAGENREIRVGKRRGSQPRQDKINYSTWKCNYENI